MNITEVKVFPIDEEKLRAFVSIVFDGCFMVNDIKIIQGREGRFISMPSRRKKNGEFKDVAHPLNNETRKMIESIILAEYDRMTGAQVGVAVEPGAITGVVQNLGTVGRPSSGRARHEPPAQVVEKQVVEKRVAAAEGSEATREKSLEEVTEVHLRDSFWTT